VSYLVFKVSTTGLHWYIRITVFALNHSSHSICIRILSTCDTFLLVTALTNCSVLTNISKIMSSSARLIDVLTDVTVTSLLLSFCCYLCRRQGGYVFVFCSVCLSVCLSVRQITEKVVNGF